MLFNVWGTLEIHQEVLVAPDGALLIPNVGEMKVVGLTLAAADSLARNLAAKYYSRAKISLTLVTVRAMKAAISGAVVNPGVYELFAVDRLSTLIAQAGGLIEPPPTETAGEPATDAKTAAKAKSAKEQKQKAEAAKVVPVASQRYISVETANGSKRNIDYVKFLRAGRLEFNPVLKDGDKVHIAFVNAETGVVNIFGAVKAPGEYEYLPGDKLRDIIAIAGGFNADAVIEDITVVRFNTDGRSQQEFSVDMTGGSPDFAVQSDDRIFVRKKPDFRRKYQVTVKGEALFPGVYSIENNVTKLSDIIKTCGGFTDRANYRSAKVRRESLREMEDPEFERLKGMPFADMTAVEYGYYKTRTRVEVPTVVVDFRELFLKNDLSQDITLVDGDEIIIPTVSPTVNVTGQVNNPGLVHFVGNKNYEYYIEKAGGFSWNARKGALRLIKAHTGMWVKPRVNTPIEIGDTIFVPEKTETDWWTLWKDILLAVSQVATVIIVIRSI